MKRIVMLFIMSLILLGTSFSQEQEGVSEYFSFISSPILSMSVGEATQVLNTSNDDIEKGIAHFRIALLSSSDADLVEKAYAYWGSLYEKHTNPVALAYYGTVEALLGGAVKRVGKKLQYAGDGIDKLTEAAEQIDADGDDLAKAYVYFLRGNTHSNLPTFFGEFKKETINNLETAEGYFKKSRASGLYSERLLESTEGNMYGAFARWHHKKKDYDTAVTYYDTALEKIADYSPSTKSLIESARALAKNNEKL